MSSNFLTLGLCWSIGMFDCINFIFNFGSFLLTNLPYICVCMRVCLYVIRVDSIYFSVNSRKLFMILSVEGKQIHDSNLFVISCLDFDFFFDSINIASSDVRPLKRPRRTQRIYAQDKLSRYAYVNIVLYSLIYSRRSTRYCQRFEISM